MSCLMSIEQKLCEVKIFQLQSMSNAIRCIDQRFAFKNSGISCLALIFNLSNLRTTVLHSKKRLPVAKHVKLYNMFSWRLTRTHGLVIKVSWSESGCSGSIPLGAETFCCPSAILHGTEPVSALTSALLHCCTLSISFLSWISLVAILHWQGFNS